MNKRRRDLERRLGNIAEQYGARLADVAPTRGGHYRATFWRDGLGITLICSFSPSDYRSINNSEARARRLLRALQ